MVSLVQLRHKQVRQYFCVHACVVQHLVEQRTNSPVSHLIVLIDIVVQDSVGKLLQRYGSLLASQQTMCFAGIVDAGRLECEVFAEPPDIVLAPMEDLELGWLFE